MNPYTAERWAEERDHILSSKRRDDDTLVRLAHIDHELRLQVKEGIGMRRIVGSPLPHRGS